MRSTLAVARLLLITDCSGQWRIWCYRERSRSERSQMSGCLCLFVLLTHLAEIAEMARGLMEVFAEYGEPHIPKHHRHRPCPHQQQAAQRWWKGQRTSVCALCFQAEKKSFTFSLSFRLCKQFQRLFMHNLFCPVGCLWVTCSVCLFSLVLSTSPLIAVSLANSFSFAF